MSDNPAGPPDPPKPPPAAIPDLKKALDNKPAQFAWSPGAARAAASASIVAGHPRALTPLERLNSTPGRLAALAVLMLAGGVVLSFTAFQERVGGGGGELGGVKSTIKSRAFRGRDSVGFSKGYGAGNDAAARKSGMNFDLIKAGENIPVAGDAAATGADGGAPMADDSPAGRAAAAAAAAGGAAPGPGAEDGSGVAGGSASGGGAAPKLNSSYGRINFQGMRRVSGTAGFRGIQGKRGTPNKTIQTRGSSANSAGAASGGGAGSSGSALTPFSPNGSRSASAKSEGGSGGGSAAAAGGGGGGGGVDTSGLDDIEQNLPSIPELLEKARAKREEADKEEKKAKILAAGGHLAQAHYHYDRAEKRKKEADGFEKQAAEQTEAMKGSAEGLTE